METSKEIRLRVNIDPDKVANWLLDYRQFSTQVRSGREWKVEGFLEDVLDAVIATMEVK